MRSLRWLGLVFSLLIVGVLGGLMAPPPSDAANATIPTITIKVTASGTTTTNTIPLYAATNTTFSTCTTTGYNYCFGLHTYENDTTMQFGPSNRQFRVRIYPNAKAQLQIADFPGTVTTQPLDKMVLTGVKFVAVCPVSSATEPCPSTNWPQTEKVTVTIIVNHKFDAQPNTAANGTSSFYLYGITAGGYMATPLTAVGTIAQIYAKGTFVTDSLGNPASGQPKNVSNDQNPDADLTVNSAGCTEKINHVPPESPLCRTIASPPGQVSFSYGQNPTYYPGSPSGTPSVQRFACTNSLTGNGKTVTDPKGVLITYNDPSCQPKITLTHVFTTFGPNTLNFTASSDSGMGVCSTDPKDKLPPCDCGNTTGKKGDSSICDSIVGFADDQNKKEKDLQVGIPASNPCTPDVCNGTIVHKFTVTPDPSGFIDLPFIGGGPRVDNFQVVIDPATGEECTLGSPTCPPPLDPFTRLITGQVGAALIFFPDYAHWPAQGSKFYQVDQVGITSANGTTIIGTDVVVLSCAGGNKTPVEFNAIGLGDTVTINWHIHTSTSPPAVCPQ
jgi:hypothetical protein